MIAAAGVRLQADGVKELVGTDLRSLHVYLNEKDCRLIKANQIDDRDSECFISLTAHSTGSCWLLWTQVVLFSYRLRNITTF